MSITEIQKKISPIMVKYGVKKAAVFGSAARGEDNARSDIDILVELGRPMGLFAYSRMVREIEEALSRKVDVVTNNSINKFIKPYVLPDLKAIYERQ